MPIKIECGGCGETYRVKEELIGRRMKCHSCSEPIKIIDPNEFDDFEDFDDEDDEEFTERLPIKSPRKKKKKRKAPTAPATLQAFNSYKTIVLVLIGILALGFGRNVAYGGGLFRLRGGLAGIVRTGMMILALLRGGAIIALCVGGVGIFQRQHWGDQTTWSGAWAMIGLTVAGAIYTMFSIVGLDEKIGGGALIVSLVMACASGCLIPGAILYCMNHADWDAEN